MRGVVMYAPRDVRVEDVEEPKMVKPGDQGSAAALTVKSQIPCSRRLFGADHREHQL
jgi:hypothetical protein